MSTKCTVCRDIYYHSVEQYLYILICITVMASVNLFCAGVSMFLGLQAEKPFKVCSTLRKVLIKANQHSTLNLPIYFYF